MEHVPVSSVFILVEWADTGVVLEVFHSSVIHSLLKGLNLSFSFVNIIDFIFDEMSWIVRWIPVSSVALGIL